MSFTIGALLGITASTFAAVAVILHYKWQEYERLHLQMRTNGDKAKQK